jgi:uncharacterized repeat protein (TIGR03803 family)
MKIQLRWAIPLALLASAVIGNQCAAADTYATIYNFCTQSPTTYCEGDGQVPDSLIQGLDGNFYGTTQYGGLGNWGTVFNVTPAGTLTRLYSFCNPDTYPDCPDGASIALLIQSTDGTLYGVASLGGAKKDGTLFKLTLDGTETTIHTFCSRAGCADGGAPFGLLQDARGTFFGITNGGGANGYGTFYKLNASGGLATLYSFCSQANCTDSGYPGHLVEGMDGNFYGTTSVGGTGAGEPASGGVSVGGVIFKVSASGEFNTLYNFCSQTNCTDGKFPVDLIQASNRDFYGVTIEGGANNSGTVFKLTPSGALTTLYNFCSKSSGSIPCTDGSAPVGLIQANDGQLYGITRAGGTRADGEVFKIGLGGFLTKLYSFCEFFPRRCTDGRSPDALIQATDGNFYGTTSSGAPAAVVRSLACPRASVHLWRRKPPLGQWGQL